MLAALFVAACGSPDRRAPGAASAPASPSRTTDQLALRVPRAGGLARVLAWPGGDSALWTSPAPVPSISAVLAFDDEDGAFSVVDTGGHPMRIELRAGRVLTERVRLTEARSADGWATFGLAERVVRRLTPTGEGWAMSFDHAPSTVVPTTDGAVLVVVNRPDGAHVYRARPPAPRVADSVVVAGATFGAATSLGDRLFLVTRDGLVGVRTRDLKAGPPIALGGPPRALVASPSGDRVFVLAGVSTALVVIDRYRDVVEQTITLPGAATALRVDPLGRWLLVRASEGNGVWVVAIGAMSLAATTTSEWRDDLPSVAPDGLLVRVDGDDVERWDPVTREGRSRYPGGAADRWHLFTWNGFRKPAKEAEPVEFAASSADSALDSTRAPEPSSETRSGAVAPTGAPPLTRGFIVSFATLRSNGAADSTARAITVEGEQARVVVVRNGATSIYRVVLGPYASREVAVRIGRTARRDYWILEGAP